MGKQQSIQQEKRRKMIMSIVLAIICVIYIMPIVTILINTFKSAGAVKSNLFALPNAETFVGFENYVTGMTAGSFPFWKAVLFNVIITVLSAFLILLLFVLLVLRGFRIASHAPDRFSALVVYGISLKLALQTILNLPLKALEHLPFLLIPYLQYHLHAD